VTKLDTLITAALLSLPVLLTPVSVRADENYFGYTYGSETLPKGKTEAYVWLTRRTGKAEGEYRAIDNYNEIEHGFTSRLQGSLYLNTSAHHINGNPDLADTDSFGFEGVHTEWKYSLTSPFKDAVGIALYVEPEYSRRFKTTGESFTELALETKLIFQKNFREDTIVSALNLSYEREWEKAPASEREPGEPAEFEGEISLEASAGVSVRVHPGWFVGLEGRAHALRAGGEEEFRAAFVGPSVHYGGRKWWFTLTVLPQVAGRPHAEGSSLFLEEHEKVETRLKVGYNF
jgi:hypothetical protein